MAKKDEKKVTEQESEVKEAVSEETSEEAKKECPKQEELSKEAQLEKALAEEKDANLRIRAEYANFRNRSVKEKQAAYNDSKADVLSKLLPVIDSFERALSANNDLESLKKGMEMIYTNFTNLFEGFGVESFGEPGETFDPNIHNAVMHIEDDTHGENEIVQVFSKGYKLGDRIIRPAMVQVAN